MSATKLTETQQIVLCAAARWADRCVMLPPRLNGAAAQRVVKKLVDLGLIEEVRARGDLPVWRRDHGGCPMALRITSGGSEEFGSALLAHHSGEKPTDRVPLPARHRDDGLDGRALGALKQGDDLRLLGASAATGKGSSALRTAGVDVGSLDRGVELHRIAALLARPVARALAAKFTITMPAWELRLKWLAYLRLVVAMPADSPNGVSFAVASASS